MGSGKGPGAFGGTQGSNNREHLLSSVTNRRLKKAVNEIYRPNARIGDGGLADAIRYERITGEKIRGRSHEQKGRERLKSLKRILAEEKLNNRDGKTARRMIDDLEKALKEKRK